MKVFRHQQRDNPLRISSESLNLDDIISDLNTNEEEQQTMGHESAVNVG